jgi:cytoskeleton protein RodZ
MDIGQRLRSAREAKGLTIDALARTTRVQARFLEAIERNDPHALPPRPYGRGSVRAYAGEVGLDPDRTVREFFLQFTPDETAHDRIAVAAPTAETIAPADARHRAVVGTVLTCAVAAAFVLLIGRGVLTTRSEPGPVGTTGIGGADTAAASTTGIAPVVEARPLTPHAEGSASAPPLTVMLEATAPSWITATADGERVLYRIMQPGEREVLRADESVRLRIGDAGAVRWRINGREPVVMGAPGDVRSVLVTVANAGVVN